MYSKVSRTVMSKRNFLWSVVSRLAGMLTSFAGRSIFVACLDGEYLGLGGFFGNIFAVVSLCELGMGAAISQSLYKPLADEDEYKVSAIVGFYTRVVRLVAAATLILSLAAIPVLVRTVKTSLDMDIVVCAYLLFVLHSVVSYLLKPKCSLVVCDQRMYVVSAVRSVFGIAALVIQSVMLIMTKNYILYLLSRILVLTVEDVIINLYADKKYPCLSLKMKVTREYKNNLYGNVKALMWHKVGGVLSRNTDSLLLTYFVGLSGMGKYSNYALVIGTIGAFFDVAMGAVSASVGNLGAVDRGRKSEQIMRRMYFINFWLLTAGSCVLACTLNPFIRLWLGEDMLFSNGEMLVIVACFYFSCIRDPVQIFVSTYGLFRQSRHLPMLRALVNFVLSVMLVRTMGVAGVFLGTTISTVAVPLFGEVRVLYKHGFSLDASGFYKEIAGFVAVSLLCVTLCFCLTYNMPVTLAGIVLRAVCSFCLVNALLLLMCSGNKSFDDALRLVKGFVKRRGK